MYVYIYIYMYIYTYNRYINRCFINKTFRKKVTVHRAVCFFTAITCFGGRWYWIFHNTGIIKHLLIHLPREFTTVLVKIL